MVRCAGVAGGDFGGGFGFVFGEMRTAGLTSVTYFLDSLEFVWFSSLFHLIGGGPVMAITLMTTIVADVAPADKR